MAVSVKQRVCLIYASSNTPMTGNKIYKNKPIENIKMSKPIKYFIFSVMALFSLSTFALDRSKVAENAEDVTPLLNGMAIPNVMVKTPEGDPVSLKAMLLQQPSVIVFYRGGWCPYCSRQLAELKDIEQDLLKEGYQILAISPETPEKLQSQKLETEFAAQLISDADLEAIKGFGIGFYVPDDTRKLYKDRMNVELTPDTNERAVLPAPAIFISDTQGNIQFSYVNPNFRVRPSAELVLSAAKIVKQPAK